jgi:uncharacterized protein (DUF2141 family)
MPVTKLAIQQINHKHYICMVRVKSKYFLLIGLFVSVFANASEQLDIRSYEAADPCDVDNKQIKVTVNGVGAGGILSVELYHDPDNFLNKKGRTRRIRIPATDEQHIVCFNLPSPGTYAIATYHDIDGNRKLNKRWNMMPKEPFGLSNNPEQHFGFPKFNDSAFNVDHSSVDITINLQKP